MNLQDIITSHPDFPKKGILFRDFAHILKSPAVLQYVATEFEKRFPSDKIDVVAGIESRGFIIGMLMAVRYGTGFAMIRKAGKTPGETRKVSYKLEYGIDTIEMRTDAIQKGQRVLVCDDLLATGGTARAAADLVESVGGSVAGMAFVIELQVLDGRQRISNYDIECLVEF